LSQTTRLTVDGSLGARVLSNHSVLRSTFRFSKPRCASTSQTTRTKLTIPGQDDEVNGNIEQLSIASAPLVGNGYKTDAQKVQQLIGFVQEETTETEIKPKEKKQDGRNDIKALRAYYGEEVSDKVR
jgi:hypothetical protein